MTRNSFALLLAATVATATLASCSFIDSIFGVPGEADDTTATIVSSSDSTSSFSVSLDDTSSVARIASSGTIDLTLELASARDVYFVFTNSSESSASIVPSVASSASAIAASKALDDDSARPSGTSVLSVPTRGIPVVTERNRELRDELEGSKAVAASRSIMGSVSFVVDAADLGSIGDAKNFYDYNNTTDGVVPVTLRYGSGAVSTGQGQRALQVWVADDRWDADGSDTLSVSQAMVNAYAAKFLSGAAVDDDIYDWVTTMLGVEWGETDSASLIDFTGVVDIVLMDIDADASTSGGILGYFYSRDNLVRNSGTSYSAYSNEMVCFVIDAVMLADPSDNDSSTRGDQWSLTDSYWPREMVSTLAHEFQHMISFYQNLNDVSDDTWAEEMMSLCVEDLVADKILADGPRGISWDDYSAGLSGNVNGRLPEFNCDPDLSLTDWDSSSTGSYARSYSFGAWLLRQYGGSAILTAIEDQDSLGADGVVAAVQFVSGVDVTFAELLGMWGASVLLSDDTGQSSPYQYNSGTSSTVSGFISTEGSTDYNLGDIDFFKFTYYYSSGATQEGPWINVDSPTYYQAMYPASNSFYLVGAGLSGTQTWTVTLPAGVYLTVVMK